MKSTVPPSPKDAYGVEGYLHQPLHQGDYDKSHPYQADNIEFPTKSYSPKGDYYSPKVDYIPKDDYSHDSYPVYESPKPYDHTLFQSGQTRKLLQQGDVVQVSKCRTTFSLHGAARLCLTCAHHRHPALLLLQPHESCHAQAAMETCRNCRLALERHLHPHYHCCPGLCGLCREDACLWANHFRSCSWT